MVHNPSTCSEHDVSELSARQKLHDPLLDIFQLHIVARRDDASLVETAIELDDDLAISVVVDFLKLADVAVLLHDMEELDNDLRARSNEDLALSSFFGVADALQRIVEDGGLGQFGQMGAGLNSSR